MKSLLRSFLFRPAAVSAVALFLPGCTSVALREEVRGVTRAYGDVLNQQMLLNIARLDNGHPAYALVVGTLNSKFSYGATAGAGGSSSDTHGIGSVENRSVIGDALRLVSRTVNNTGNIISGGSASLGLTGSATPDFQLIPLNNSDIARQLLQSVPAEVFYSLYQQGFPLDQIMRMLVEQVEVSLPQDDKEELIYTNSISSGAEERFAEFLRLAGLMREIQLTGRLKLEDSPKKLKRASPTTYPAPTAKQVLKAKEQKLVYVEVMVEKDGQKVGTGTFELGEYKTRPIFYIRKEDEGKVNEIVMQRWPGPASEVRKVVRFLIDGLSIKGDVGEEGHGQARLNLRSYAGVLRAVAAEQNLFLTGWSHPRVPGFEALPILQTVWKPEDKLVKPPLVTLRYADKRYIVTDREAQLCPPTTHCPGTPATWNRDVFRLLVALSAQVSVDISQYQRQVLEVR